MPTTASRWWRGFAGRIPSWLLGAIRGATLGETWVHPRLLTGVFRLFAGGERNEYRERVARLTERERAVLDRMVAGLDRPAIARELFLSLNTVNTHVRNVFAKLEVHSNLEAVSVALRARG